MQPALPVSDLLSSLQVEPPPPRHGHARVHTGRVARFIPINYYAPAQIPFHVPIVSPAAVRIPLRPRPAPPQPSGDADEFPLPENKADVRHLLRDLRISGPGYLPNGYDIVGRGRMPGIIFHGGVVQIVAGRAEEEGA
jgi:hypothetical protein